MIDIHAPRLHQDVIVDGPTGRPVEIRSHGRRLTVSAVDSVRDETAAYPAGSGPRTVFVVRAQERRYRLVHLLHHRRWTVEELPAAERALASAA